MSAYSHNIHSTRDTIDQEGYSIEHIAEFAKVALALAVEYLKGMAGDGGRSVALIREAELGDSAIARLGRPTFEDSDHNIHSTRDTIDQEGYSIEHIAEFAKVALGPSRRSRTWFRRT
jgi:hypothetical protein